MDRQLVIIGAGPAGMAAAVAAARAGLDPLVIDENPQVGGQIYRQPAVASQRKVNARDDDAQRGSELLREFKSLADRIELLPNTSVWGLFHPRRVAVFNANGAGMIQAEQVILAPGAYEYVPPFPGWTLPGVMTPGGAQLMVKSMRIVPGRRVLLAGTGPFLLVVADHLLTAGVELAGIVEAARRSDGVAALGGLVFEPRLLRQGWNYLRRIRRAGIPIHWGHVLVEARGQQQVDEAVFAPCDRHWYPDRSRARRVQVDTICVGYGFVPRMHLAQLAGCRMQYDNRLGGWIAQRDVHLRTSAQSVWVAGDGAGVAGALVAELEGTLAGLDAAQEAGALDSGAFARQSRGVLRRLARLRRFRAALDRVCEVREGLSDLAAGTTVVCRCEELTLDQVRQGVAAGSNAMRTLKVTTRLGMGPCQGRMCSPAMARWLSVRTGRTMEQIGPLSARPPIKPLTVGDLGGEEGMVEIPMQPTESNA